jgi:hypothetical protein
MLFAVAYAIWLSIQIKAKTWPNGAVKAVNGAKTCL